MNIEQLQEYSDAWNRHDIDRIMHFMTDDCVFETGAGHDACGTRYEGLDEVKKRFIEVWESIPDIRFENARHFVHNDRGCSEWTLTGTRPDGTKLELNGCDLFTFRDGKIRVKNSFLKKRG
jgi:ketosteroid isomerase-like protein